MTHIMTEEELLARRGAPEKPEHQKRVKNKSSFYPTEEEKEILAKAAKLQNTSVSKFVLAAALKVAKSVIAKSEE